MAQYTHRYISPLGDMIMSGDGEFLTGLHFDGSQNLSAAREKISEKIYVADFAKKSHTVFELTDKWLDLYFSGCQPNFTPPLIVKSTPFRREVWEILLTIPYGKTITYGEIAQKIARQRGLRRMSAQAVGNAVGRNPIALIIPCHRVIGTNGTLVGYAAGTEKKAALLRLEQMGQERDLSLQNS